MKKLMMIILVPLLILSTFQVASANQSLSRGQAISLVENTFKAQVSLSEKPRAMEDIFSILKPYVTNEYRSVFLKENLVYEDGAYQTYGTDFAPYYIPFFRYDERTKFALMDGKGYVFEKFDSNMEGPVLYNNEYQGVQLVETSDGWRVNKVLSHEEVLSVIEMVENENSNSKTNSLYSKVIRSVTVPYFIPMIYITPIYHSSYLVSQLIV